MRVPALTALFLLAVVFIGVARAFIGMALGEASSRGRAVADTSREGLLAVGPPIAFGALVLVLGLYVPPPLLRLVGDAAGLLGIAP